MQRPPLSMVEGTVRYGDTVALNHVNLTVPHGSTVAITGPNGSGKTTLLRSLFGAQRLSSGCVEIKESPISKLSTREIACQLAVVSQFDRDTERMRVDDLVLMGRSPHLKDMQGYSKEDHRLAAEAIAQVGLTDISDRYIHTLSGGERQRALIARALTQHPLCMLLDEPTNHLDIRFQHQVLALIRKVATTSVIVLHDLNLVCRYCDLVAVMNHGNLEALGSPEETLTPELIKSVWGVSATKVTDNGVTQLILGPPKLTL